MKRLNGSINGCCSPNLLKLTINNNRLKNIAEPFYINTSHTICVFKNYIKLLNYNPRKIMVQYVFV